MSQKAAVLEAWFIQISDLDHSNHPFPHWLVPFIPVQLCAPINFCRTWIGEKRIQISSCKTKPEHFEVQILNLKPKRSFLRNAVKHLADYLRNGYIFGAYMYNKHYNNRVTYDFWYFLKVKSVLCILSLQTNMGPLLRNITYEILLWNTKFTFQNEDTVTKT